MCLSNKDELNSVVIEYAMKAMGDYALTCKEFQSVVQSYHHQVSNGWKRCESDIRTVGLSRPYVVASCDIEGLETYYSDYSGKKQRQTILSEFPLRKKDFSLWYGANSKPYQHKVLYDHITTVLGTIGTFTSKVKHPIGYCAEQNVANRLMLVTNKHFSEVQFSLAIRPKTGEIVPYCDNCKTLFNQLSDAED